MIGRRLVATALAFSLAGISLPARVAPLGVLMQAADAYMSSNTRATAGATLYDGDRLSTQSAGVLRLRSGASMLYLGGSSSVTLHQAEKGIQADLTSGSAVFSSAQRNALRVQADGAQLRAATDAPTIAQISILGPKELAISAKRGSLEFAYHDEGEVIPEGASYRVILDPPEGVPAFPYGQDQPRNPKRRRKGFVFILIGGGAAIMAWLIHEAVESPFKPE
jgi:hypothetical protein